MEFFKILLDDLTDIICPGACLVCGCHLKADNKELICPACMQNYAETPFLKKDEEENENVITESFKAAGIDIVYGCTFLKFDKKGTVQRIIHGIKYFHRPELGVKFGRIAALRLQKFGRFSDVNYILPVPMHPKKLKIRGYNQAEKIAEGLASVLNIPIRTDILQKTVYTETQTHKNKAQRLANSLNVYKASKEKAEEGEKGKKHFLLVDDVYTTGATLESCSRELKRVMPECEISVFALAKA